jgi:hypothetical protein
MHPAAEQALDLLTTPRTPAELLIASRAAWDQHGYPLNYACFSALIAFADNFEGPRTEGTALLVLVPRPQDDVVALVGSQRRGNEALAAIGDLFERVLDANNNNSSLAPGPTLQQIDREFKGNAAFLMAQAVGSGLMTLAAEGRAEEYVIQQVRQFLEDLSR